MNLEKEITSIVASIIQVEEYVIRKDASFFDDYGMDSLRVLEILAEIENRYKITVDPEKLSEMTCLDKVINITRECLGKDGSN